MIEQSKNNLMYLAYELAQNYFLNSSFDLHLKDEGIREGKKGEPTNDEIKKLMSHLEELSKEVLIRPDRLIGEDFAALNLVHPEKGMQLVYPNFELKPSRNILVIGAGATYNAFQDIPLAKQAIDLIHTKIKIGNFQTIEGVSITNFYEFVEYLKTNPDEKKLLKKNPDSGVLYEIGRKYTLEYRRLKLLSQDTEEESFFDFENALNLLAKIFPISTVREKIGELYARVHGPTLLYHIIAHLFKNRMIDVIINFNFDELLDQILEEEMRSNVYDKIISDGDCYPLNEVVKNLQLRQPLYIKPHGTASHKSTLRFTKDQYHELPPDLRIFLQELLQTYSGKSGKKKINLITVGFGMGSLEFNEMVSESMGKGDQIFSFFHHNNESELADRTETIKINEKDEQVHKDGIKKQQAVLFSSIFKSNSNKPNVFLIGHSFFADVAVSQHDNKLPVCTTSFGSAFYQLFKNISDSFQNPFKPRGITKHLLICEIFGNKFFWREALTEGERNDIQDEAKSEVEYEELLSKTHPKYYFNSEEYYKDRLILEILIHLSVNQGVIDLSVLTRSEVGYFYNKFYSVSKSEISLHSIVRAIGLSDYEFSNSAFPKNRFFFYDVENPDKNFKDSIERFEDKILSNKDLLSKTMRGYFEKLNQDEDQVYMNRIKKRFAQLYHAENCTIQSNFRSTKFHVFENYLNTDLITTDLTIDLIYWSYIKSSKDIHAVCVVDDYADRLAKFLPYLIQRNPNIEVYLLAEWKEKIYDKVFLKTDNESRTEKSKAREVSRHPVIRSLKANFLWWYKRASEENIELLLSIDEFNAWIEDRMNIRFVNMNNHNYHMTIFLPDRNDHSYKSQAVSQRASGFGAIYYYNRGLTRTAEPIHISEDNNLEFVLRSFQVMSKSVDKETPFKGDNWIEWNES